MTRHERFGFRDQAYSQWHRNELPDYCRMVDQDWVEYHACGEPLALIEAARDVGQIRKNSEVTRRLAEKSGVHSFTILYGVGADGKLNSIRIQRTHPDPEPTDGSFDAISPDRFKAFIIKLHHKECPRCGSRGAAA